MRRPNPFRIVEYFAKLTLLLKMRFHNHRAFSIHCVDILNFAAPPNSYSAIICSLPFSAFSPESTATILQRQIDLAKDGAIMSFFEYKVLQGMAKMVLPSRKWGQFLRSQHLIKLLCQRYEFDHAVVKMNIPPAMVHYLRIDKVIDRPHWRA